MESEASLLLLSAHTPTGWCSVALPHPLVHPLPRPLAHLQYLLPALCPAHLPTRRTCYLPSAPPTCPPALPVTWLLKHMRCCRTAPVDGADAGDAVVVTHPLRQQPVPDLPGKHGGVLAFVIGDLVDHFGSSNLWFGSPDHPGADTSCFIVPATHSTDDTGMFLAILLFPLITLILDELKIKTL